MSRFGYVTLFTIVSLRFTCVQIPFLNDNFASDFDLCFIDKMSHNNATHPHPSDHSESGPMTNTGSQLSIVPVSETVGVDISMPTGQERGENLVPPRNLQDLLRLSTSLQTSTNSMQPIEPDGQRPIDVERQQFLKNVLESLSVDVVAYIKERVSVLKQYITKPDPNILKYEVTLEEVMDQVDSIDMANVFYQVGGLEAIVPMLKSEHSSLRWMAAGTIATCCQNNPFCQKLSAEGEIIAALINMAASDTNATAKFKAVTALSAIVRDNPEGVNSFRHHNGFPMVRNALGSANEKMVAKTSYLIMALCDTDKTSKGELLKLGIVENLVSLARLTENLLVEHFLRALDSMTRDHIPSLLECLRKELMLSDYLSSLLVHKASDESYMEIRDVAQQLLDRIRQVPSKT